MGCGCGGRSKTVTRSSSSGGKGVRYYKIVVGGAEKARARDWAAAKQKRDKYGRLGNPNVQIITDQGRPVDESGNPR